MSERRYVHPPTWSAPPGYTHAVSTRGGPLLFVSGQVPLDPSGNLIGGTDFKAQARQALANLGTVLATAGATYADIIKLTYFVVDLDTAKVLALREARDEVLPADRRPASTLLGVTALFRPEVVIEIEAVVELPATP